MKTIAGVAYKCLKCGKINIVVIEEPIGLNFVCSDCGFDGFERIECDVCFSDKTTKPEAIPLGQDPNDYKKLAKDIARIVCEALSASVLKHRTMEEAINIVAGLIEKITKNKG